MENLTHATIDPSELPQGFQAAVPSQGGAAASGQQQQQQQAAAAEEQRLAILQQALTAEALARLRRIKLVKESNAKQVENGIIAMAMNGKLPARITEAKLIEMLERGSAAKAQKQTSISIQRKKYAFDSDDDDDDDEDLM